MRKNSLSILLIVMLAITSLVTLSGCKDKNDASSSDVKEVTQEETSNAKESDDKKVEAKKESKQDKEENESTESSKNEKTKKTNKSKKSKASSKKSGSSSHKGSSSNSSSSNGGSSSGGSNEAVKEANVSLTVEGVCSGMQITVSEGASVYDVLKKSGANIGASTSAMGVYVYSINGLSEGDKGPGSGWVYTINGVKVMKSANKATVKDGDNIKWSFVKG